MAELSREKFEIIGCENLESEGILRPSMTYWQDAWRRLKQNKVATFSLILLIVITLMTIFGPMMTKFSFEATDNSLINVKPNGTHWFGTDNLGRDLFARVWKGGRISIIIGLAGAAIDTTVVGSIYGGIAGYLWRYS
jgi:oligopeptide transport system permease protein